jgi:hypothetical protein
MSGERAFPGLSRASVTTVVVPKPRVSDQPKIWPTARSEPWPPVGPQPLGPGQAPGDAAQHQLSDYESEDDAGDHNHMSHVCLDSFDSRHEHLSLD